MQFHFLGTTGYHPNRRRDTACFMIPELGIILDAGTGMFRVRDLICTPELHIFLSHTHLDHIVGLTFLLDVLYQKDVQSVTVYVDPEKRPAIERHLFHPLIFPVAPPFHFADLPAGPDAPRLPLPGGGWLRTFPLIHPGGCLGFRLAWPERSMAYITDTTADLEAEYVREIAGVDLLVHECYFPDGKEELALLTGHSCLTPVAQVAAASCAKRTCLVHLSPLDESDRLLDLSSVATIYPHFNIPEDGEMIEF